MGLRSWRGARFMAQSALGRLHGFKHLGITAKDATDVLRGA